MLAALCGSAFGQTNSGQAAAQPGYAGGQPGAKTGGTPPAQGLEAGQSEAAPRREPVLLISGVEVMRSVRAPELDIVRVRGLSSTEGWEEPELVPLTKGAASDGVLDLMLLGSAPAEPMESTGFTPIEAIFVIEPGHPYKGIRVHGAMNRVTLMKLPGYADAAAAPDDCSKCIGKYLVTKGAAMPAGRAAGDVVREENLPTTVRVIKSASGVGKLNSDPNRLTLVLDDDGRIVIAVWD